MTDPFADLERELLAAHGRRPPRRTGPPRVFAVAAAALAAVAGVGWLGARGDTEQAVQPASQPAEQGTCDGGWIPPGTSEPAPSGLMAELAIFRERRPDRAIDLDPRMIGGQATRVYRDTLRVLPPRAGYSVYAIVADIVPRSRVVRERDPCAGPKGETEPGACLVLSTERGSTAACFTLAELEGGEAFLDVRDMIIGLAPDSARLAIAGENRTHVEGNLFTLPGGPRTQVDFQP